MVEASIRGHAVQDNLRHTLLLASALQVLRPDYRVIQRLENAVRRRGDDAIVAAEQAIDGLRASERKVVFKRFDDLCAQLPDEALAA